MSNQTGNRHSNHQTWKRLNKKPNLSRKERKALHVLQQSKDLNFKKADKGNTLVVMDKNDKEPNLKNILMEKWHLIQNQPSLRQIFKEPTLISFKRGKSLKDILISAKL